MGRPGIFKLYVIAARSHRGQPGGYAYLKLRTYVQIRIYGILAKKTVPADALIDIVAGFEAFQDFLCKFFY